MPWAGHEIDRGLGAKVEQMRGGKPIVVIDPEGAAGTALRQISREVAARVSVINLGEGDE